MQIQLQTKYQVKLLSGIDEIIMYCTHLVLTCEGSIILHVLANCILLSVHLSLRNNCDAYDSL